MIRTLPGPRTIVAAVVAGLVAGCSMLLCYVVINSVLPSAPDTSIAAIFTFNASALVGKVAYSNDAYVALGIALHFLVSIGWALGYAVAARRQRQLLTRPIISGAAFGLIIYFAMQLVLVAASLYHTPTPRELGIALVAHLLFYGIPVALVIARVGDPAEASDAR